jgi:DmsE family decaheme c-type cytochrome
MRTIRQLLLGLACLGALHAGTASAADAQAQKQAPVLAAKSGDGKGKADEREKKDIVLNKDAKCTSCHDEADSPDLLAIGKTRHGTRADSRTPSCTSCHGASNAHTDYRGPDKPPKPDVNFQRKSNTDVAASNGACLTCHQGGKLMGWQSSTHALEDTACASCHKVHRQKDQVRNPGMQQAEVCFTCHKEQRTQFNKVSHHPVVEGKMSCSSCHNVHGNNPKALKKPSVNEVCYTCHMEFRGPFVHNHQPVTEDCGICHQNHGNILHN